jgi:hypothetical protein
MGGYPGSRELFRFQMKHLWLGTMALVGLLLGHVTLASAGPSDGPIVIGSITVFGPNVSLNGHAARSSSPVRENDRVTIGVGSNAFINLAPGGVVQFDENTSVYLRREGQFTTIKILHGRIFVEADGVRVETSDTTAALKRNVNVQVMPDRSVLTTLHGDSQVSRPEQIVVRQAQQLTVLTGGAVTTRDLSDRELASVTVWRTQYHSLASPRPSSLQGIGGALGGSSPSSKSAPGGSGESWQAPPALTPTTPSGSGSVWPAVRPGAGLQPAITKVGQRETGSGGGSGSGLGGGSGSGSGGAFGGGSVGVGGFPAEARTPGGGGPIYNLLPPQAGPSGGVAPGSMPGSEAYRVLSPSSYPAGPATGLGISAPGPAAQLGLALQELREVPAHNQAPPAPSPVSRHNSAVV